MWWHRLLPYLLTAVSASPSKTASSCPLEEKNPLLLRKVLTWSNLDNHLNSESWVIFIIGGFLTIQESRVRPGGVGGWQLQWKQSAGGSSTHPDTTRSTTCTSCSMKRQQQQLYCPVTKYEKYISDINHPDQWPFTNPTTEYKALHQIHYCRIRTLWYPNRLITMNRIFEDFFPTGRPFSCHFWGFLPDNTMYLFMFWQSCQYQRFVTNLVPLSCLWKLLSWPAYQKHECLRHVMNHRALRSWSLKSTIWYASWLLVCCSESCHYLAEKKTADILIRFNK